MLCLAVLLPCASALGQPTTELLPEAQEKADQLRRDLREMIVLARDRVFPALVNIKVITVRYYGGKERKGQAVGSGTIISREGHVLTNFHVVRNGKKFKCTLADKQEISADLVGEDPLTDLAVLKLDLSELKVSGMPLSVAQFGDSDEMAIGDTVMAMGSPWALSRSVTLGIVSNTERVLAASDDDAGEMYFDEDQRTGIFNRWIQHDAAINPGNSGGPLVNLKGELIGVNARGSSFGGDMGFAIPANVAQAVVAQLIEHGEVPRSWLGLDFKPIKKSGFEAGVLINSIVEDGPAARAGLQAGDVVTEIDGGPITVWFPEEVPPLLKDLADRPVGSAIAVSYLRGGETHEATITTEKLKKDRGDEAAFRGWGLVAVDITEKMARERRLESTDGVLIDSVRGGSPAELAEPALMDGDVLRAIDGIAVPNLAGLIERYDKIMEADELPEYLLVEFDRRGTNQVTLVKPKPDEDVDPPREVAKAWIGVAVQPVIKKLAEQMGLDDKLGFRITRVYPRTIAADSDLKVGDVIISLNDDPMKPRGMQDAGLFYRQVRRLDIDDDATVTVLRDGEEQKVTLKLERTRITPEEARRDHNRDFEIVVREVTFFDRDENRWDDTVDGVIVAQVESAGWAQLGGIWPGDLIQRIDEHTITGLSDYRTVMEEITKAQPERVVFVVMRGARTHFQYVEPDWRPAGDDEKSTDDEKE
ncbi:MAG: PDZ domain-containing protein [Phycisphaerales bacterium]|nr:PDZ domain-containing protein [Phycisphaerales bacterium]